MNQDRILRVAAIIERLPCHRPGDKMRPGFFNLGIYTLENCGSPGCIAGWTIALHHTNYDVHKAARMDVYEILPIFGDVAEEDLHIHSEAQRILELQDDTADQLFTPHPWPKDPSSQNTARVMRQLAKTGIVSWGEIVSHTHHMEDKL